MGALHLIGIANHINDHDVNGEELRKELSRIPPHSIFSRVALPAFGGTLALGTGLFTFFGVRALGRKIPRFYPLLGISLGGLLMYSIWTKKQYKGFSDV